MTLTPAPPAATEWETRARAVVTAGLERARQIAQPERRLGHLFAWCTRLARLDPDAAEALLPELAPDPEIRARALTHLLEAVAADDPPAPTERLATIAQRAATTIAAVPDPEARLHLLNEVCEIGMAVAARDPARGIPVIETVLPLLAAPGEQEDGAARSCRALAAALVGEGLAGAGDPRGLALLDEAEALATELPGADHLAAFLAQALAPHDLDRARALVGQMVDPWARLNARLTLLSGAAESDPAAIDLLASDGETDAELVEGIRAAEGWVRLGQTLAPIRPERARRAFERAMAACAGNEAQLRSMQRAGIAAAAGQLDPDWARHLFEQALADAAAEPDRLRGMVATLCVAMEWARFDRERAQALLDATLAEAAHLESLWELGYVAEVVFDPRRETSLDLTAARPFLEAALARVAGDDPRLPGMFGIDQIGRCFLRFDPARAAEVFRQWLAMAEALDDVDGMIEAAAHLYQADERQGRETLRRVGEALATRLDCGSVGHYCQTAAAVLPDRVCELAPRIGDPRERLRAQEAAACGAYLADPERGIGFACSLSTPQAASHALLAIADHLLGLTGEAPPVLPEDTQCCPPPDLF